MESYPEAKLRRYSTGHGCTRTRLFIQGSSQQECDALHCKICDSAVAQEFGGEVALHFVGFDGRRKPIVWVFPKVLVCLDCGFAEFAVPDEEVKMLRNSEARITQEEA